MKLLLLSALFFATADYSEGGKLVSQLGHTQITTKWHADFEAQTLLFSITFGKNPPPLLLIGFSDHGQLNHSDAIVWKNNEILDSYINREFEVETDLEQDWELVRTIKNGVILSRSIITCDPMDYAFQTGTTQFIIAASWRDDVSNLESSSFLKEMRFAKVLGEEEETTNLENDAFDFEVIADHAEIPTETTNYWCIIKPLPVNIQSKKHHIVGMDAVVQPGNEHLVHHMEIFLCLENDVQPFSGNCNDPNKPKASRSCSHVIAAWAMGEGPISYPSEAGLPIGGKGSSRYVMVEIHYNNPGNLANVIDNSGFKFIVTPSLREYDAAIMELGLIYSDANSIPPGQLEFAINAHCISECTENLPAGGINIFGSQLHAHLTGTKLWTSHYRNGVKIGEVNRDEHYSPHWQHVQSVRPYVNVRPGDNLITTCVYDTTRRQKTTLGGYGIEDEMCVNYIYYYPASEIEVCKSAISNSTLRQYFKSRHGLEEKTMSISEMYNAVEWNERKSEELRNLFAVSPLNMACLQQDSTLFPSHEWSEMKQPTRFSGAFVKTRDSYECPAINN
ncbi:unnamed protein product [Caenorhabditis auriculariae]|uniref:Tyramine beta-hydroxylase n=1 Tax=Caenorhabditis auriculariae TaxID=2777116 RepID=A0A8S1H1W7_9PELO|nr:unnamed protein product [Caenorhabditis auriculariae]